MARAIYEIKLREHYFPALSENDALEMQINGGCHGLPDGDLVATPIVTEEHTMKLFVLAVTMYDTGIFTCTEVEKSVSSLARELGYYNNADELADAVIRWVERLDGMTLSEVEEWLIG